MASTRVAHVAASGALLLQLAVGSMLSKEAGETFARLIKEMTDG